VPKDFHRETARLFESAGWVKTDDGKGSHEKWDIPLQHLKFAAEGE
jgi:hypothetical protein